MSGQVGWGGKGRSRCTHSKKKTTKKKETAPLGSLSLSEREREREREKKNQKPRVGPVGGATQTPVKNHITPTISGKASKLIFLSFSLSLSLSLCVCSRSSGLPGRRMRFPTSTTSFFFQLSIKKNNVISLNCLSLSSSLFS